MQSGRWEASCWTALVALVGAAAGCGGGSSTGPGPGSTVATVAVTGISQPIVIGGTGQAVATARDASGTVLTRTFTWTTSNAAVATVGADGTVTGIAAGSATITASVDGKSGALGVTINNAVPSVSTISPASVTAGASAQTLTVIGTGYVGTSVVRWNGTGLATTFVSATQLTAQLPASDLASATAAQVTVFNPAPGGGASTASVFTVSAAGSNPVPAITGLSPTSIAAGSGTFTLIVTGTNFLATSTVQWNGAARATTFVSGNQLTAQIAAGDVAAATTASVTVVNPAPGGGASAAHSFSIFGALPTLTYADLPVTLVAQLESQFTAEAQTAAVSITAPGLPHGGTATFAIMHIGQGGRGGAPAAMRATGDCPLITPSQPGANGAGLPTTPVTYTFSLLNCTDDQYTSQEGIVTLADPNPAASTLDYDITVPHFVGRIGDSTGTIKDSITAVDSVRNATPGLVNEWVVESHTLDETGSAFGHLVETLTLHTVYTYPAASGQLLYNVQMFPGTIVVDQTATYVIAPGNNFGVSGTFTAVTTTPTVLQWDPTCQSDIKYVGGVLQTVVAGRVTTTTYHACGTSPTIE